MLAIVGLTRRAAGPVRLVHVSAPALGPRRERSSRPRLDDERPSLRRSAGRLPSSRAPPPPPPLVTPPPLESAASGVARVHVRLGDDAAAVATFRVGVGLTFQQLALDALAHFGSTRPDTNTAVLEESTDDVFPASAHVLSVAAAQSSPLRVVLRPRPAAAVVDAADVAAAVAEQAEEHRYQHVANAADEQVVAPEDAASTVPRVTVLFDDIPQPREAPRRKHYDPKKDAQERSRQLLDLCDLRQPHLWYPGARLLKRKIVLHVGPTNSGKTHHALQALKGAASGIYCGPLRLLAHEIYDNISAAGIPCNLLTGQKKIVSEGALHTSCTTEMADLNTRVDVAVLDEFQLLGDTSRGWAWSRAFLGLQAQEIHLCGNESALSLVVNLAKVMREEVEIKKYERLVPLEVLKKPVPSLSKLRPGDCIIAFSRRELFSLRALIESDGGAASARERGEASREGSKTKCAIVYGSLPPENRLLQAALFNEPGNDHSILVASDAIGLGCNYKIKRIIFSTLQKFDGVESRLITPAEARQIAGRAGRYGKLEGDHRGEVTCIHRSDLQSLQHLLSSDIEETHAAGIFPTSAQLELFASKSTDSKTPFSKLLESFEQLCTVDQAYFFCDSAELIARARVLDSIESLSLSDRYIFCMAPVDIKDPNIVTHFYRFASTYARAASRSVPLNFDLSSVVVQSDAVQEQMKILESSHRVLDLYLWLGQRLPKFDAWQECETLKSTCEALLAAALAGIKPSRALRRLNKKRA